MKTKVVIFDFDGTLTISKSSTWGRIWEKIDALEEDQRLMDMYFNNEIDYETWVRLGCECIKEHKFTQEDFDIIISDMNNGAYFICWSIANIIIFH